jgi:hypothetical protein
MLIIGNSPSQPRKNPMNHASIGSISHGTLRTADLLEAFAGELEYQVHRNAKEWRSDNGRKQLDAFLKLIGEVSELIDEASEIDPEDNEAMDIVAELQDALEYFSLPYCYFGTHEGDGSDFGYWPCMDQIAELPKVNDPADVPEGGTGEDCVFVNDHGNVRVYGADGSIILEIV